MPAERSSEGKTRSRAGCLTCRGRHKKCDETRLPENRGACRRCFTGSWDCQWPLPPGNKPLRSFVSGSKRAQASNAKHGARNDSAGATLDALVDADVADHGARIDPGPLPVPPPSTSTSNYDSTLAGSTMTSAGVGGSIPVGVAPSPFPFLPSSSTSSSSLPISSFLPTASSTAGSSTPNPYADLDVLAPASSFSTFLAPPEQLGDDLSHFFSSLDAEVGYWDSLQGQVRVDVTGAPSGAAGPSETSAPGSAVEPDSPPVLYAGAGLTPLAEAEAAAQAHRDLETDRERVEAEEETVRALLSAANGVGSTPTSAPAPAAHAVEATASSSAPLAASARKEKRPRLPSVPPAQVPQLAPPAAVEDVEPVEVDPIYNTFNDGFFRSLPKPVREVVVQHAHNVAGSSDLSRHAAMAMVMLYRLRVQQQAQQASSEPLSAAEVAAASEQHAKLLAQSDHYFQKALEHLQTPIPFEAKMVAVLDMQTYQFDQWGAAAANAILLLAELFINEALGSQPSIDLSDMRDPKNVLLSAVAWSDCVRCICIPRRRTIFAFSGLPGEPSPTTPEAVVSDVSSHSNSIDAHLGLPLGLLLCVAATANLGAEMDALPDEVVRVKAAAIENAIREWKPAPPNIEDLADSAWYIDKLSSAEMWRHAIIIFLYQVVHRHGPLSRVIREAMQQILQLGSRMLQQYRAPLGSVSAPAASSASTLSSAPHVAALEAGTAAGAAGGASAAAAPPPGEEEYLSAPSMRAVPWFLAGTCAQLPSDRALCRRGIEVCGRQQGYRDNVSALERIWEVTDDKGWTVDWRSLLQTEQRFVGWL
ncbi:hypothetical protein JCM9279_005449 [Rhodotorula babjevae]